MTHDPMKIPFAMLAGVAVLSTAIAGCIAPQGPCVCPSSSAPSAASGSDTSSKSSSSSNSTPSAKPTGTLIFDGKSAGILNVNPGGSWFSMNDKTSKGKMVPEGNDFATVLHGGAVHTSGKGYTDWGGGIGFNFVGADSLTPLDAGAYTNKFDAKYNWWGASIGPNGLCNLSGLGGAGQRIIDQNLQVDCQPFLTSGTDSDSDTPGFQPPGFSALQPARAVR